jgi:hypothetical protein
MPVGHHFLYAQRMPTIKAMADTDAPSRDKNKYIVRFPPGLRDRIARAAKGNRRSMNQEIVSLLELHYPEPPTIEESNAELNLLTQTIKFPMSRFDLGQILDLIGKLRDKIAEMSGDNE